MDKIGKADVLKVLRLGVPCRSRRSVEVGCLSCFSML